MPIAALPPATVRAIGSTSVISDPCSLVKELLDNALDANASLVAIEISQNTLDVISVKDNGHGISSEDHAFVCKRTFTSKIQTVKDLRNIGGTSLGFRGEALASAAEMSGSLTVSTRIAAELVGSSSKYGRNGDIINTQRTSHPVGTSVRVADFLKHIPVRRQTSLKNASKNLKKIKKMLQMYAMAQPSKRLSFKVLKAKNENNNWMYAPSQDATLVDTALKVAGKEVSSHCVLRMWPSGDPASSEQPQAGSASQYQLTAFLPRPDFDPSKVNNSGQYLIVDGRPISSSRGIGQNITKLFKSYLRFVISGRENTPSITDPFLCLHLRCPVGTYDVNIEPAKDDILFENAEQVLSLVEGMFQDIYGKLPNSSGMNGALSKTKQNSPRNNGFDLLMARKDPIDSTSHNETPQSTPIAIPLITKYSQIQSPLSKNYRRDARERPSNSGQASQDERQAQSRNMEAQNPWSVTKLNQLYRTPDKPTSAIGRPFQLSKRNSRQEPNQRPRDLEEIYQTPVTTTLPSPATSHSNSVSPTGSHLSPTSLQSPQTFPTTPVPDSSKRAARERDRERYGNGALDTWFMKTTQTALHDNVGEQANQEDPELSLTQLAQTRFGSEGESARNPSSGIGIDPSPRCTGSGHSSNTSRTSQSPSQVAVTLPHNQPSNVSETQQSFPRPEQRPSMSHPTPENQYTRDLENALDFERRKREAIQRRREQMRNHHEPPSSSNPHQSRYLAARAVLNSDLDAEIPSQALVIPEQLDSRPKLNPYDPRASFMRQQKAASKDGVQARRANTSKLPLEKIPDECSLHDTGIRLPFEESLLSASMHHATKDDLYTQGKPDLEASTAFDSNINLPYLSHQLANLIKRKYKTIGGDLEPNLNFNFAGINEHPNHENE